MKYVNVLRDLYFYFYILITPMQATGPMKSLSQLVTRIQRGYVQRRLAS